MADNEEAPILRKLLSLLLNIGVTCNELPFCHLVDLMDLVAGALGATSPRVPGHHRRV